MKTTLDIPDPLFRQAKAKATLRGVSFRQFVTELLEEKVCAQIDAEHGSAQTPWMRGFGALADLHQETCKIDARISDAFEFLEEEDYA